MKVFIHLNNISMGIAISSSCRDLPFKVISLIIYIIGRQFMSLLHFCIFYEQRPGYICCRLFVDGFNSEQPWKIEMCLHLGQRACLFTICSDNDNISLWGKGQACLLPIMGSLGFLSVTQPKAYTFLTSLLGTEVWGHCTNADTLATVLLLGVNWPSSLMQESYVVCQPLWNHGCLTF